MKKNVSVLSPLRHWQKLKKWRKGTNRYAAFLTCNGLQVERKSKQLQIDPLQRRSTVVKESLESVVLRSAVFVIAVICLIIMHNQP